MLIYSSSVTVNNRFPLLLFLLLEFRLKCKIFQLSLSFSKRRRETHILKQLICRGVLNKMKQILCQRSGTKISHLLSKNLPVPRSAPFCYGISRRHSPIPAMSNLTDVDISQHPSDQQVHLHPQGLAPMHNFSINTLILCK